NTARPVGHSNATQSSASRSNPGNANLQSGNRGDPANAAARSASNGLPFTVRPGKIYFVAMNGSDRHSGRVDAPWKSIVEAKERMSPGDVTYIKDGVTQTSEDHFTAYLSMDRNGGSNSGKAGAPKALVAYPG